MTVTRDMTIAEVGAVVSAALSAAGIHAVLSGGAVVSVYSENEYESKDLDFISSASIKKIANALATFRRVDAPERTHEPALRTGSKR